MLVPEGFSTGLVLLEVEVLVLVEEVLVLVEEILEEAGILLDDLLEDLEEVLEEAGILLEDLDEALIVKELSVGLPEDGFSELGFPKKELEEPEAVLVEELVLDDFAAPLDDCAPTLDD